MLCVLNGIAEYIVGAVLVADLGRLEYCLPFLSFFYIYIYNIYVFFPNLGVSEVTGYLLLTPRWPTVGFTTFIIIKSQVVFLVLLP